MAKASLKLKSTPVLQFTPDGVSLELTHEEARVLRIILSHIAGNPATTLRGHITNISEALEYVGYEFNYEDSNRAANGRIQFTEDTLDMEPTCENTDFNW